MGEQRFQENINKQDSIRDQLDLDAPGETELEVTEGLIFPSEQESHDNPLSWHYQLTKYEIDHPDELENQGIIPGQARKKLEDLGYKEVDWQEVGGFSHELFALVIIARGNKKRLLKQVVKNHMSAIGYKHHLQAYGEISKDDFPPPGILYETKTDE